MQLVCHILGHGMRDAVSLAKKRQKRRLMRQGEFSRDAASRDVV